jgi:hypothetical protein
VVALASAAVAQAGTSARADAGRTAGPRTSMTPASMRMPRPPTSRPAERPGALLRVGEGADPTGQRRGCRRGASRLQVERGLGAEHKYGAGHGPRDTPDTQSGHDGRVRKTRRTRRHVRPGIGQRLTHPGGDTEVVVVAGYPSRARPRVDACARTRCSTRWQRATVLIVTPSVRRARPESARVHAVPRANLPSSERLPWVCQYIS